MRADLAPSRECEDACAFLVASTVCVTLSSLVVVASCLPLHCVRPTTPVLGPDGPSSGGRKNEADRDAKANDGGSRVDRPVEIGGSTVYGMLLKANPQVSVGGWLALARAT